MHSHSTTKQKKTLAFERLWQQLIKFLGRNTNPSNNMSQNDITFDFFALLIVASEIVLLRRERNIEAISFTRCDKENQAPHQQEPKMFRKTLERQKSTIT